MGKVASDWASRRHCPPGSDMAVNEHKAIASGFVLPKPARRTDVPGMDNAGGPGPTKTPGYFSTGRK